MAAGSGADRLLATSPGEKSGLCEIQREPMRVGA
jgi:hypothetical protein